MKLTNSKYKPAIIANEAANNAGINANHKSDLNTSQNKGKSAMAIMTRHIVSRSMILLPPVVNSNILIGIYQ
jgi:hypothetical protein